jgi:hypothetical protein
MRYDILMALNVKIGFLQCEACNLADRYQRPAQTCLSQNNASHLDYHTCVKCLAVVCVKKTHLWQCYMFTYYNKSKKTCRL